MSYYAEDAALVVKPGMVVREREYPQSLYRHCRLFPAPTGGDSGKMEVIEGGGNALVIMETRLDIPTADGYPSYATRHLCLSEAGRTLAVHRR